MEDNRAVIYARVSTADQDADQQIGDCKDYAFENNLLVTKIYKEEVSAYKKGGKYREQFNKMLEDARADKFRNIIVWNFDRMFRNHKQAIETVRGYSGSPYNIQFHFLNNAKIFNSIRTMESPMKEMMFDMILHYESWRSQAESEIRSARVKKAFATTKKKWGRPKTSKYIIGRILALKDSGLSIRKISQELKISVGIVHKTITENAKSEGGKK